MPSLEADALLTSNILLPPVSLGFWPGVHTPWFVPRTVPQPAKRAITHTRLVSAVFKFHISGGFATDTMMLAVGHKQFCLTLRAFRHGAWLQTALKLQHRPLADGYLC